jgi:hypothetical protein
VHAFEGDSRAKSPELETACSAQFPIEPLPHRRSTTDRDFVPWRFLNTGRMSAPTTPPLPAFKNLHNNKLTQRSK